MRDEAFGGHEFADEEPAPPQVKARWWQRLARLPRGR
jgi:hypothetical protein